MPNFSGESFLDLIGFVLLLPLAGAIVNGLVGKRLSASVTGYIGCVSIGLAFLVSILVFIDLLKLSPGAGMPIPSRKIAPNTAA